MIRVHHDHSSRGEGGYCTHAVESCAAVLCGGLVEQKSQALCAQDPSTRLLPAKSLVRVLWAWWVYYTKSCGSLVREFFRWEFLSVQYSIQKGAPGGSHGANMAPNGAKMVPESLPKSTLRVTFSRRAPFRDFDTPLERFAWFWCPGPLPRAPRRRNKKHQKTNSQTKRQQMHF